MKVSPIPFDLDLTASAPGYERSKGLHISEIYGSLYRALDPKRYAKPEDLVARSAYMGVGLAFEEMLEQSLKSRLTADSGRPGEFVESEHGIIYSPDLLIFNGSTRLGEIKLTWLSCKDFPVEAGGQFPPKADKWLTQMKLYCRCLETPYARLYALFVNGNWDCRNRRERPVPEPRAWDITFTKRELDEEWKTCINHAKHVGLL